MEMAGQVMSVHDPSVAGHDGASGPAKRATAASEGGIPAGSLFAAVAVRAAELVDRHHKQLEVLQQREDDPQRLAGLFSLDHIAAQLRRNSNAALVLADLPTIRSIRVPTLLSELVYAAVSEVNGYQRVSVGAFPTRRVHTRMASDLVHLLGDLLDNALAASPRAAQVWIRGERPDASAINVAALVQVGNSRANLSNSDLEDLNNVLAGRATPSSTGGGVGMVVAREIAGRHGMSVRFSRLAGGGLLATVELPVAAFERLGAEGATIPRDARTASTRADTATRDSLELLWQGH
jgi:signal transduction histidine kinase